MSEAGKPDALFYHLEQQPLEDTLPVLLEKSLARGWKAVVQSGDEARLGLLDKQLWTYSEDSFLAHGTRSDAHPEWQPIYLTTGHENPNGAQVRIFVHGSEVGDIKNYQRLVFLFDGGDNDAVALARTQYKAIRDAGFAVTYWRQNSAGRWERKA